MKIIVLGAGFANKGNEAMLRVVQSELIKRIDDANIFALLPSGEDHSLAYASGVIPVSRENFKIKRYLGTRFADRVSVMQFMLRTGRIGNLTRSVVSFEDVSGQMLPMMIDSIIGGIDAVVDIHGYAFGDPWSLRGIRSAAAWGEFCIRTGKPYCFFPQTWGPFERKGYAEETSNLLKRATIFYAREVLSQAELAKALNKPTEEIPIAPDTVFRFESGPSSIGEELLRRIGVMKGDKSIIGITPNMRVYERTPGVGAGNNYVRLLSHLCEYCMTRFGANVVLIPNEIYPRGYIRQDDRYLCNLIASKVGKPMRCFAFRDYHSAEDIRSVISCLDLLVGSRFHTLVFALSVGVPLVALGWAHKYDGLLRQFGLHDYFCHYSQFDEKQVFDLVDRAWKDRKSTSQSIRSALPRIQADVDTVFDAVARFCRGS